MHLLCIFIIYYLVFLFYWSIMLSSLLLKCWILYYFCLFRLFYHFFHLLCLSLSVLLFLFITLRIFLVEYYHRFRWIWKNFWILLSPCSASLKCFSISPTKPSTTSLSLISLRGTSSNLAHLPSYWRLTLSSSISSHT